MLEFLQELRKVGPSQCHASSCPLSNHASLTHLLLHPLQHVKVGIVGGSDLHKIAEQLGSNCERSLMLVKHWRSKPDPA